MTQITPLLHHTAPGASSVESAPAESSLDQRLLETRQQAHDAPHDKPKPVDTKKWVTDQMLLQMKNQILFPDPDDPSSCPTLQVDPSW